MPNVYAPDLKDRAFVGLNARYQGAFDQYNPYWPQFATRTESSTITERYWWEEHQLVLRKWVGDRVYRERINRSFDVLNELYEGSFAVSRRRLKYDQLKSFGDNAAAIGMAVARHPDRIMHAKLALATTTLLAYDGQPVYDASHPVSVDKPGLGTYSNSLNLALGADGVNFGVALAALMVIPGADGTPLNIGSNFVLHVPAALRDVGAKILESEIIAQVFGANTAAASSTNIQQGRARLVVDPWLDTVDTTRWYVHAMMGDISTWNLQVLEDAVFEERAEGSDVAFETDEYHFGARWDGTAFASLPQFSITSKP